MSSLRQAPHHKDGEGESQTNRALLQMRELIVKGEFKPGGRIFEVPLSKRLGVSRTPLRLALDRLEQEGLLRARRTSGFVVSHFTAQDILDAIDLRGLLEGAGARMAAERLRSDDELRGMRESVEQASELLGQLLDRVTTIGKYTPLNTRFHSDMVSLSRNEMLQSSLKRVLALPFASPNAFISSDTGSDSWREALLVSVWQHRAIVEAISNREGGRAEGLAREHSRLAGRGVATALKAQRYDAIPGGSLIRF